MKIVVITGSAHQNGTSAALADEFIKGVSEKGHNIYRFNAGVKNVHPCIGCNHCHETDKGCVFKDDMTELNPHLLEADMIVFATPIYYYNMNAQIRCVIDRFYANDAALHKNKKAILITTMADTSPKSAEASNVSFTHTLEYLGWENAGILNGIGLWKVESLDGTDYREQAYKLGQSI